MQHNIVTDTKALCRVCMTSEMEHSVNLNDSFPSGQHNLHEMLKAICAPVFVKSDMEDVMPEMPTKVCLTCRDATVAAYSLHLQCIETDRRLGELVALMWELQGPREDEVVRDGGSFTTSSSKQETVQEAKQDCSQGGNAENKTCLRCGKKFSTRAILARHKKERRCDMTKDPKQRTCDICNKVFRSVQLLKKHREKHGSIDRVNQTMSDGPCPVPELPASEGDRPAEEIPLLNIENVDFIKVEALDVMDDNDNDNEEEDTNVLDIQCTICGTSFTSRRAHKKHTKEGNCQRSQTFPCMKCGKVFDKNSRLQYHMISHTQRFECSRCRETFKSKLGLRKHMKRINQCSATIKTADVTSDWQCINCGVIFLSARAHRNHTQQGNCERRWTYSCKQCGKIFDNQTRMQYHLFSHMERLTCGQCDKTFKYRGDLVRHIQYKRCLGKKANRSQQDQMQEKAANADEETNNALTITMQALDTAMEKTDQAAEQQPMQGEQGDAEEESIEDTIQEPDRDVSAEEVIEIKCADCGVTFSSERAHRDHTLGRNCQRTQYFPCTICGKVFDKKSRLGYHRYNHKKRLACPQCDDTFKHKGGLLQHIKLKRCLGIKLSTVQPVPQEELEVGIIQENVEERFEDQETREGTNESLVERMQGEQGGAAEATSESLEGTMSAPEGDTSKGRTEAINIQCTDCGVTFLSTRSHRDHVREKCCQQMRTFPCKICGKVFDKRSRMDYHMYSHKKRWACPQCDKTFKRQRNMLQHIKFKRCKKQRTAPAMLQGELEACIKLENIEGHFEDQESEEGTNESLVTDMQALEGDTFVEGTNQAEEQHQMQEEQTFESSYNASQNQVTEVFDTQEGTHHSLVVKIQTPKKRRPMRMRDSQCTDCGVTFTSKSVFKKHIEEGNCKRRQIFPCTICGKIFDKLSRMRYHRRNHQERVPCSNCHRTFRNRYCRQIHLKRTAACRNAFEDSLLNSEIKVEEPKIEDVVEVKFECTICGKIFDKLSRMQYHRRNHQGRVPCSNCHRTFRNRLCLQMHRKRTAACRNAFDGSLLKSEIKVEESKIEDAVEVKSERSSPCMME